jgi:GMP synthase (glutamine-hydrolysing)
MISDLSWKPKGVVLSGGPYSVYGPDAPHVDQAVFELGAPILGICYWLQEIAWHFRKNVLARRGGNGHAALKIERHTGKEDYVDRLFQALETTFPYGCRMETHHLDFQITSGPGPRP